MHTAAAAEAEFYAAFAATDYTRMQAVWSPTADCLCIHPAGPPIAGYDAVMASWADILGNASPIELRCEPVSRIEHGDTVISTVYEHFAPPGSTPAELAPVLATNVYQRVAGQWKMMLHHASPVMVRQAPQPAVPAATRH